MRLPLQDSPKTADAPDRLNELRKLRKADTDGLHELIHGVTDYQQVQDERMRAFLDYSQTWLEKQKSLAKE